jgi:hypothetical protein
MLDPWFARANRVGKVRLLLTVFVFLAVAGAAAFVGVLVGSPRSPVTISVGSSVSHAVAPSATVGPVAVGPQPVPNQDCNKAVPWMQACARTQHRVAPVPEPSVSPTP